MVSDTCYKVTFLYSHKVVFFNISSSTSKRLVAEILSSNLKHKVKSLCETR